MEADEGDSGGPQRRGGDGRTWANYPGAREAAAVAWRRGGGHAGGGGMRVLGLRAVSSCVSSYSFFNEFARVTTF